MYDMFKFYVLSLIKDYHLHVLC